MGFKNWFGFGNDESEMKMKLLRLNNDDLVNDLMNENNNCCGECCKCNHDDNIENKCGCNNSYNEDHQDDMVQCTIDEILSKIHVLVDTLKKEGLNEETGEMNVYDFGEKYNQVLRLGGYGVTPDIEEDDEIEEELIYPFKFIDDIGEVPTKYTNILDTMDDNTSVFINNETTDLKLPKFEINNTMSPLYDNETTNNPFYLDDPVEITWACKEGVEPPTKNDEDMGFDVKAHFEEREMVFQPFETKLVPTGLYAAVPVRWGLVAKEKGSTGSIGMKCGAGVVDSGYRGEIFIAITNENNCKLIITKDPSIVKSQRMSYHDYDTDTDKEMILYPYKKGIAQLIVKFNPKVKTKVVDIEELKNIPSIRGEGKLGSTDIY